jgi:flagellar basal-body rod modification protein FlgD
MSLIAQALTSSAAQNQSTPAPAPAKNDPLADESTFLKLLVSQLQNQDPLNPTDSNQFVSQLTAYSQLEQLIGINKNTTPVAPQTGSSDVASATTNTTTTTTTRS